MKVTDFVDAAKDHYWDSFEPQRELIIKHIESIAEFFKEPENCEYCKGVMQSNYRFTCKDCGRIIDNA